MNLLQQFFKNYIPRADTKELEAAFKVVKKLKKKELLIRPNQYCAYMAFINKGAFRVYFHDHHFREVTTWFSFEGRTVTDLLAYYQATRAQYYVQALEESEVLIAQKRDLEDLFQKNADFKEFGRLFAEEACVLLMNRMVSLHTKSAEERYKEILEQPEYLQKIPLKYLASFLGVTDSSLSRIRKNLS